MKNSFVNRIILILIIFCIVPFLFFTFVFVMNTKSFDQTTMHESLTELINNKALLLEKEMTIIENETTDIAEWVSSNLDKTSATSVDGYINDRLDRNDAISYVLFIPEKGSVRNYFKETYKNEIRSAVDFRKEQFYRSIKAEGVNHEYVEWSRPYYDYYAGKWVLTCSSPVFNKGRFSGVISSHILISNFAKAFQDTRLGKNGFTFILDRNGYIMYHPDLLSRKGYEGEILNLNLKNKSDLPAYNRIIDRMVNVQSGMDQYQNDNMQMRMIVFKYIELKNLIIAVEVNKSLYMAGYEHLSIGFWFLIFGLMFAVLFFISKYSHFVTEPIVELTNDVKRMSEGEFTQVKVRSNDEIGMLGEAYNSMSRKLHSYTESLLYSNEQLETVINSIVGVMMIIDLDYGINMINLEGQNILRHNNIFDAKGKKCYKVFFNFDEPCKGCPVAMLQNDGLHCESEIVYNMQVFEISAYPVKKYDHGMEGIVVYSKKITEQIYLERKLNQSEKMAAIGKMVAGITHELKNPLSVIKGATYLLKQSNVTDEVKANVIEEIDNNVKRAEKIVYNMLDFSRTSTRNGQINLKGIIEQILMLVRQDLVSRRIVVNIVIEEEPCLIFGNPDSFKHIFLNMITNSIEAIENSGEIGIRARKVQGNWVEIIFSDTGKPISKVNVDKIFEPFFTTRNNGTGLGLWIVSNEVHKNNGTIKAFYEDNKKFIINLPQENTDDEEDTDDR